MVGGGLGRERVCSYLVYRRKKKNNMNYKNILLFYIFQKLFIIN